MTYISSANTGLYTFREDLHSFELRGCGTLHYMDVIESFTETLVKMGILGIKKFENPYRMILYSEDDEYTFCNFHYDLLLISISRATNTSLLKILEFIFLSDRSLSSLYFCVETIRYDVTTKASVTGPCFIDGSNTSGSWVMTLPICMLVDELAYIIKTYFFAIGGILKVRNGNETYQTVCYIAHHCPFRCDGKRVSHVICSDSYKFLLSLGPSDKTELLKYEDDFDIKVPRDRYAGYQFLHGFPLDFQIEACAMVAGISPVEMRKRMDNVSY